MDGEVRNRRQSHSGVAVGVAWYRRQEWESLRQLSADRDDLEETYDDRLRAATARLAEIEGSGVKPQKIDIAVDHLMAWCDSQGRVLDAAARAAYTAQRLRELHLHPPPNSPGA